MSILLTWEVTKTISTGCPDYKPNPYTGEYPGTHCLVLHYTEVVETRHKTFKTKKEALAFALKAPDSCDRFELDGKPLKDKRPKSSTTASLTTSTLLSDASNNISLVGGGK